MHRLVYRNFGDHESLVLTHTVGAPASTTFLVSSAPASATTSFAGRSRAGTSPINEQATYAPADGVNRWMAERRDGRPREHRRRLQRLQRPRRADPAAVFPGVRYAGRLASDPAGRALPGGEHCSSTAAACRRSTGNRWGDYSALSIDPRDDCTFWYTQEYYTAASQAANTAGWLTRIGSFKVDPACVPAPHGLLRGTITYCDTGLPVAGALVEVSDGHSAPTLADGTYQVSLSPGTYQVHVTGPELHADDAGQCHGRRCRDDVLRHLPLRLAQASP